MYVYTIQQVVNRFDNRFDNRLYRVNGALQYLLSDTVKQHRDMLDRLEESVGLYCALANRVMTLRRSLRS